VTVPYKREENLKNAKEAVEEYKRKYEKEGRRMEENIEKCWEGSEQNYYMDGTMESLTGNI